MELLCCSVMKRNTMIAKVHSYMQNCMAMKTNTYERATQYTHSLDLGYGLYSEIVGLAKSSNCKGDMERQY